MVDRSVRPEDVLPEDENYTLLDGIRVRKGTIGAALKNASVLTSSLTSQTEKEAAQAIIIELAPALVVLGMCEHVVWKNPTIQQIIEAAAERLQGRQ